MVITRPTVYKQIWIVMPFHCTFTGKNNILTNDSFGWGKVKKLQNLSFSLTQCPSWKRMDRIVPAQIYIRSELFTAF